MKVSQQQQQQQQQQNSERHFSMNHFYHLKKLPGILLLCISIVHLNAQEVDINDLESLETTTLISTRTQRSALESPASIISINLSEVGFDSAEDAGDAVRKIPGVSIPFDYRGVDALIPYVNGGYKSYNIRGVEGNRVLIQIDGIRQVPEYSEYLGGGPGGTTRAMFDPKIFESIEILKGSASALYGSDALGGVVSFKTTSLVDILEVSEKPWYLSASATYTGVNEGINLVGKAGVRSGDFYATLINSYRETSEQQNTQGIDPYPEAMTSNHTLLSLAYIPSEEHRFSFVAENFSSDSETDFTGIVYNMNIMGMPYTFDYWENASSEAEVGRDRLSFKYENIRNDGGLWDEFSAHLYTQSSNSDIITRTTGTVGFAANSLYPGYAPTKRDRYDTMEFAHDSIGLNLLAMKKISSDSIEQTIIVGADFSSEDTENTFLRADLTTDPIEYNNRMSTDPSTLKRFDLFAQDEIDFGDLTLTAGIRYAHYKINPDNDDRYFDANPGISASEDYTNDTLTPSLAVVYLLDDTSAVWGRYAMGIKNPTNENYTGAFSHSGGDDPFIIMANPDLDPESSNAFEAGYRKFSEYFQFEVSVHKTFYEDFIDSTVLIEDNVAPDPDIYSHANIEEVEIYGIEMSLRYQLEAINDALKGFSIDVSSAWTEGENKTDDIQLSSVTPFEFITSLNYQSENNWGGTISGTYRSKKSHAGEFEERGYFIPDSSFVLDAFAYWNVSENVSIKGGLRNLTDEKYWIWTNSTRGGHSSTTTERNVQPGLNAYISLTIIL